MLLAQLHVERRCRSNPLIQEMKLNEGVIHKVVIAQEFYKLFRRQVIPDIGKTYSRGNSGNAANSTEKRRFPDQKAFPLFSTLLAL